MESFNLTTIIIILIGIALFGCYYQPAKPEQLSSNETNATKQTLIANTTSDSVANCLLKHGLTENIVFFIYADWCPYCAKMKEWVKEVESEPKIFWANVENASAMGIARECLAGIAQFRYVPEFVCPANKENHVGVFSTIDEMRAFVMACKK